VNKEKKILTEVHLERIKKLSDKKKDEISRLAREQGISWFVAYTRCV